METSDLSIRTVPLEKRKFAAAQHVAREVLDDVKLDQFEDYLTDQLVFILSREVLVTKLVDRIDHVDVPASPWDMWKERKSRVGAVVAVPGRSATTGRRLRFERYLKLPDLPRLSADVGCLARARGTTMGGGVRWRVLAWRWGSSRGSHWRPDRCF